MPISDRRLRELNAAIDEQIEADERMRMSDNALASQPAAGDAGEAPPAHAWRLGDACEFRAHDGKWHPGKIAHGGIDWVSVVSAAGGEHFPGMEGLRPAAHPPAPFKVGDRVVVVHESSMFCGRVFVVAHVAEDRVVSSDDWGFGFDEIQSAPPPPRATEGGKGCTTLTASWCPACGDCECEVGSSGMDDPRCPLHSPSSHHAEWGRRAGTSTEPPPATPPAPAGGITEHGWKEIALSLQRQIDRLRAGGIATVKNDDDVLASFLAAKERVNPLAALERQGEDVSSELLDLRMKAPAPAGEWSEAEKDRVWRLASELDARRDIHERAKLALVRVFNDLLVEWITADRARTAGEVARLKVMKDLAEEETARMCAVTVELGDKMERRFFQSEAVQDSHWKQLRSIADALGADNANVESIVERAKDLRSDPAEMERLVAERDEARRTCAAHERTIGEVVDRKDAALSARDAAVAEVDRLKADRDAWFGLVTIESARVAKEYADRQAVYSELRQVRDQWAAATAEVARLKGEVERLTGDLQREWQSHGATLLTYDDKLARLTEALALSRSHARDLEARLSVARGRTTTELDTTESTSAARPTGRDEGDANG